MFRYAVVEDNPIVLKGTIYKMNMIGYPFELVGTAENGQDGYSLIQQERPDLVIIDMKIPGIDGAELMNLLRKSDNDVQIIIASGYSDFHYAHAGITAGAVAYLLKPFSEEELRKTLDVVIRNLNARKTDGHREHEVDQLVNGLYMSPVHPEMISFEYLKIDAAHGLFVVADIISRTNIQEFNDTGMFDEIICYTPIGTENVRYLIGCRRKGASELLQNDMLKHLPADVHSAGISIPVIGIDQLYVACRQARQARMSCPIGTQAVSIWKSTLDESLTFSTDFVNRLFFDMEAGDSVSFEERLLECYHTWRKKCFNYLSFVFALRNFFCQALERYERMADSLYSKLPSIYQFDRIPERPDGNETLIHNLIAFISTAFSEIASHHPVQDPIVGVKRYMEKNFKEDLSLDRMADMACVSVSHLSHNFSRLAGVSFSEYLTTLRIENAKRLLIQTSDDIGYIAYQSGFRNDKYFYRLFKKEVGVTPSEYRNRGSNTQSHDKK